MGGYGEHAELPGDYARTVSPVIPTTRIYFRVMRGRRGFYDRVIRWYSRSAFTHAEFCWPLTSKEPPEYLGAQPGGGVAIRPADYLGDAIYDLIGVDIPQSEYERLRFWLRMQLGKPYDFRAIVGMVFPGLDNGMKTRAWFCSELVYYGLAKIGARLLRVPKRESDRITPRDLWVSPRAVLVRCNVNAKP